MNEDSIETESRGSGHPATVWQQNHGNLLLGIVALIVVVGASILAYRQNRFVPVQFPHANVIEHPVDGGRSPVLDTAEPSVVIKVSGAANDLGSAMVAIYESVETFNDPAEAIYLQSVTLVEGEGVWKVPVKSLPRTFAVSAYHDENGDEKLNLNRFGIPTERYGYSRNARGITGPPDFDQAKVERPESKGIVAVFVR